MKKLYLIAGEKKEASDVGWAGISNEAKLELFTPTLRFSLEGSSSGRFCHGGGGAKTGRSAYLIALARLAKRKHPSRDGVQGPLFCFLFTQLLLDYHLIESE